MSLHLLLFLVYSLHCCVLLHTVFFISSTCLLTGRKKRRGREEGVGKGGGEEGEEKEGKDEEGEEKEERKDIRRRRKGRKRKMRKIRRTRIDE